MARTVEGVTSGDFKCRCCGACCRIKDGIVRVSEAEIARIAAFLGKSEEDFMRGCLKIIFPLAFSSTI